MKTSDRGLALIQLFEGVRLKAYKCPAGVWTIGYGHTATAYEGMTITREQATELLRRDVARFENYIRKTLPIQALGQDQFDALVSFTFNLGSIKGTLRESLLNNDKAKTIRTLALYVKAGGRYLLGLHRRRLAEAYLFAGVHLLPQELEQIRQRHSKEQIDADFIKLENYIKDKGN